MNTRVFFNILFTIGSLLFYYLLLIFFYLFYKF